MSIENKLAEARKLSHAKQQTILRREATIREHEDCIGKLTARIWDMEAEAKKREIALSKARVDLLDANAELDTLTTRYHALTRRNAELADAMNMAEAQNTLNRWYFGSCLVLATLVGAAAAYLALLP